MALSFIDTHAHLDMEQFDRDRAEVIARAKEAGVERIITVGIDLESSRKAIELAKNNSGVWATVGFHPHEAGLLKEADRETLVTLAANPRVVAIGEIGLDYFRNRSPREVQLKSLKAQLNLAVDLDLPIVIHCRQAERDMLPILKDWTASRKGISKAIGVIHCFNADGEAARQYLEMGFFLSLGAYIGYPTYRLNNVIRNIPADRLLLETDAPFLPPQSRRGKRNESSFIPITGQVLAAIRKESLETVAAATTRNACTVFSLPGL